MRICGTKAADFRNTIGSILLFSILSISAACARDVIQIPAESFERIDLTSYLEIFEDPIRILEISDVSGELPDNTFVPATRQNTNVGFSSSAIWVRFTVAFADQLKEPIRLLLDAPLVDSIQFFTPVPDGGWSIEETGDGVPFRSRQINHRNFNFKIESNPAAAQTYYMRLRSDTSAIQLPLYIYSQAEFESATSRGNFVFGIYFGLIALLIAASLATCFMFKTPKCVSYCAYLISYLLFQLSFNGFGFQLLWPDSPLLQAKLPTLFCGTTVIFGILFSKRFLELGTRSANIDRVLLLLTFIGGAGVLYHLSGSGNYGSRFIVGCGLISSVLIFFAAARANYLGYRPARLFLIGWTLSLIGAVATGGYILGIGPNLPGFAYAVQLGSLFQIVFVSLALAHQITDERQKKDLRIRAGQDELRALNESLERQVADRTQELEIRNQELIELAVRDGLTGLYNHSTTIELLKQVVEHSKRYDFPTTVMMLDIDDFKSVNDTLGHPVGDKVIVAVSQVLVDELRKADVVGRYGGDEFLIVLSHADLSAAREHGERLLDRIRGIDISELESRTITASLGISILNSRDDRATASDLIWRADQAMYSSKQGGRDRLTISNVSLVAASR
ncbi:MAG: diguanylate cyclase (GGDEF)-like protein [Gammaproteobacteria bacterium]|jgi:diguanylate cyclase (GGDEF)-like protein